MQFLEGKTLVLPFFTIKENAYNIVGREIVDTSVKIVIAVFVILVLIIAKIIYDEKKYIEKLTDRLKKTWGMPTRQEYTENIWKNIKYYYDKTASENNIDDITWNDLSMNTVYKRMNTCFSSVGQEYLYKMLRLPFNDRDKLDEADRLAAHFDSNKKDRENIQQIFYKLGFAKKISVSDYVGLLMDLKPQSNIIHYLSMLFIIVSFVIAFGYNATLGIILVVASVAFAIISYYSYKAKAEPFFICIINIVFVKGTCICCSIIMCKCSSCIII